MSAPPFLNGRRCPGFLSKPNLDGREMQVDPFHQRTKTAHDLLKTTFLRIVVQVFTLNLINECNSTLAVVDQVL